MVLIEAYSYGTPVIACDVGNNKNLVVPSKTGLLFTYNSVNSFIETIYRFLDDNEDYSDSCRKFYEQNYTSSQNYGLLMTIYGQFEDYYNDKKTVNNS